MTHEREKSHPAIGAVKPANKVVSATAESAERHGGAMLRMDGGDRGERERAKHAPADARVGAGSNSADEHGANA